jgi:hypothetical protein
MAENCLKLLRMKPLIVLALLMPGAATAAGLAPLLATPTTKAPPQTHSAVLYELRLRLPEGRGLAQQLMQAGVNQGDAAAAAKLAAGHLGDGVGGCDAKVEVSRALGGDGLEVQRVVLMTQAEQTIIERRQGELTVASARGTGRISRLV